MAIHSNYSQIVTYKIEALTLVENGPVSSSTIILPDHLYRSLRARVGEMTISDNETTLKVDDVISSSHYVRGIKELDGCSSDGRSYVIVGSEMSEKLGLQNGSPITLANTLKPFDQVVDNSLADAGNPFGKDIKKRAYIANGLFNGYYPDRVAGQCEIFLTSDQISYLQLNESLRPLCGQERYESAKNRDSGLIGVIQIFHNDRVWEAMAYHRDTPCGRKWGSTVAISKSLYRQLGSLKLGESLTLCSRFDVHSEQEAAEKREAPILADVASYDAIAFFKEHSSDIKSLKGILCNPECAHTVYEFIPQIKLAHFLESLTHQAESLVKEPKLLVTIFDFLDRLSNDLRGIKEFEEFLDALKGQKESFLAQEVEYMSLLSALLEKGTDRNPLLLDAFFKMELPLKTADKKNYFHLMFELNKGSLDGCDYLLQCRPFFTTLLTEADAAGETPLHTLCRQSARIPFILTFGREIFSNLSAAQFNIEGTTPFHSILKKNRDTPESYADLLESLSRVTDLFDIFQSDCLNWFDIADKEGQKPLDYLDFQLLIDFLEAVYMHDQSALINKVESALQNRPYFNQIKERAIKGSELKKMVFAIFENENSRKKFKALLSQ